MENSISPDVRELFHKIAQAIMNEPAKYREAGKWLDEYCSEDAYLKRQEDNLKELQAQKKRIPTLPIVKDLMQLEKEIEEKHIPPLLLRFQAAQVHLVRKYKDQEFIPIGDARRIILITWLLTDPDAEKANLNVTELEKWQWEPIDDVLSRSYAGFLFCHGGIDRDPWMKLVRVAWHDLKRKGEKWYQTNTFKIVVIPIATALFIGIPTWISLTKDSQTTDNSSKEVEESPAKIEEVVTPPILSLLSKEINQTDSGYAALLKFEPSKNQPLRKITFVAKLVDNSSTKIVNFSPVGISMDVLEKISSDGKEAQLTYTIMGGYPKLKLETSDTCKILLSGSHITKPITVQIE